MSNSDLGSYLIVAFMAMAVSMALIPLMIRLAPKIGMIDLPDDRKVHINPIPRVGGVGIVAGLLLPLLIWLPFDNLSISFLTGVFLLLFFGVWDDIKELGHYVKFIGQFLAAILVVYYGDLYVTSFPFMGVEPIAEGIGRPFTVIAIVGMINAINHSDGLDGLAGGETLLSLAALVYLGYLFEDSVLLFISAATIGGVFGFLRFNSHPARVFMGDAGSQVLGFIVAVLVVQFTQRTNTAVSPAVPVLLLGLPIIDILAVFFLRAKHGMDLFKATKNHVHHRLLELGFYHYESVVIIYSIQVFFVVSGVLFCYESDALIIGLYLGVCAALFSILTFAERNDWTIRRGKMVSRQANMFIHNVRFREYSSKFLEICISLFLVGAAFMSATVPTDIGILSLILLVFMLFVPMLKHRGEFLYKLIVFVVVGFCVYLLSMFPPGWLLDQVVLVYIYFIILAIAVFVGARLILKDQFPITPLDYLVIIMALVFGLIPGSDPGSTSVMWMVIKMIILFYACELVVQNTTKRLYGLTGVVSITLVLISIRGLL